MDIGGSGLHGGDAGANHVIGPDHQADAVLPEHLGIRGVILGRDDHQRATMVPFPREGQHLVRTG